MLVAYAPNIRFHWLERDRILLKTCDGFVSSKALRETYEAALRFVEANGVTKALSDNRALFPTGRADLEWIERDWLPRMLRAGWRHWAVLGPTTALGAMNMKRWLELYGEQGITIRSFEDSAAAMEWLRQQPDGPAPRELVGAAPPAASIRRSSSPRR